MHISPPHDAFTALLVLLVRNPPFKKPAVARARCAPMNLEVVGEHRV
jgi:hypothetical protein